MSGRGLRKQARRVASLRRQLLKLSTWKLLIIGAPLAAITFLEFIQFAFSDFIGHGRAEAVDDVLLIILVSELALLSAFGLLVIVLEFFLKGLIYLSSVASASALKLYQSEWGAFHSQILSDKDSLVTSIRSAQMELFKLSRFVSEEDAAGLVFPVSHLLEKEDNLPSTCKVYSLRPPLPGTAGNYAFRDTDIRLLNGAKRGVQYRLYVANWFLDYLESLKKLKSDMDLPDRDRVMICHLGGERQLPRHFGIAIYAVPSGSAGGDGTKVAHRLFGNAGEYSVDCFLVMPLVSGDEEVAAGDDLEEVAICVRVRHKHTVEDLLTMFEGAAPVAP